MILSVTVVKPDGEVKDYEFDKDAIIFGRSSGNDVSLDISGISRYHFRVTYEDKKLLVEDLKSTNGTFINSIKVENISIIKEGDIISVGKALIYVKLKDSKQAKSNAVPPQNEVKVEVDESEGTGILTQKKLIVAAAMNQKSVEFKTNAVFPADEAKMESQKRDVEEARLGKDFYWQSLKSFLHPIWEYIEDDSVTEIMINGPKEIYYERKGTLFKSLSEFTPDQINAAVINIAQYVGRRVSEEEPYLDARLPDGSRVAVLMPPCSRKGTSVSIRKFAKEKLTLEKLLEYGSLNQEMIMYLKAAVLLKKNIIVAGGTSSGKTSLLNVVTGLIPNDERIITIEDSAELQLRQDHVLPMETKPADKKGRGQVAIRDLVKASLRMRPDRIIVGEIRGGEALDLLQAMNTGHSGSMATVHASSPKQALTRLETLALFSGLEIPIFALREQVSSAVEVIIQASRLPDHSRKVVCISEVEHLTESGEYRIKDIFKFQHHGVTNHKVNGEHVWTGNVTNLLEEMKLSGLNEAVEFFTNRPVASR
ncbi:MAG: Flp pilus assembly complex ATPase component TadA [Proteobacteria bacterium]|nr:Flp pilus assembly complex ATPase component TadA [Pseudomonadota bacterium]